MKKFTNLITALVLKSGINITTSSFAVKHGVMVGNLFFNPLKISVNVGIEDQVLSNSQIYPNPTKGIFKFRSGIMKDLALEVFLIDISGKTI